MSVWAAAKMTPNKAVQLAGLVAEAAKSGKYDVYHGSRAVNIEVNGIPWKDFQVIQLVSNMILPMQPCCQNDIGCRLVKVPFFLPRLCSQV